MPSNIAHRRAAKAARRKKALASRRAAEPVSLADKVRQLAAAPLHCCLMHGDGSDSGMTSVILARVTETGGMAVAAFLIDTFALGIKDVVFRPMEPSDFDDFLAEAQAAAPLTPVDPSHARKLVRSAAAYAASIGLRAPRGFASIELFFGNVRAEDCAKEFVFGRDGKPFYVVSPFETPEQVAKRLDRLSDRLGPDGFVAEIPISDDIVLTNAPEEPEGRGEIQPNAA